MSIILAACHSLPAFISACYTITSFGIHICNKRLYLLVQGSLQRPFDVYTAAFTSYANDSEYHVGQLGWDIDKVEGWGRI